LQASPHRRTWRGSALKRNQTTGGNSVAKETTKTLIEADGLRYKSKAPGSPFAATSSFGAATMSCFLCGKHRPRAMLKSRKLLGKSQPVCAPSCKELEEQLATKKP
jgi:hypothetical protein